MRRSPILRRAPALLAALLVSACARSGTFATTLGPLPAGLPDRFVLDSGVTVSPDDPPACHSPLLDPRDGTRLRLVAAAMLGGVQQGDYEAPAGRYGLAAGAKLRIDCTTGRPLGVSGR